MSRKIKVHPITSQECLSLLVLLVLKEKIKQEEENEIVGNVDSLVLSYIKDFIQENEEKFNDFLASKKL